MSTQTQMEALENKLGTSGEDAGTAGGGKEGKVDKPPRARRVKASGGDEKPSKPKTKKKAKAKKKKVVKKRRQVRVDQRLLQKEKDLVYQLAQVRKLIREYKKALR